MHLNIRTEVSVRNMCRCTAYCEKKKLWCIKQLEVDVWVVELASEMRVMYSTWVATIQDNCGVESAICSYEYWFCARNMGWVGGDLPTQRNSFQFEHDGVLLIRKWVCFDMILLVTLIERINNQFFFVCVGVTKINFRCMELIENENVCVLAIRTKSRKFSRFWHMSNRSPDLWWNSP